jgi:type I restriction enzyme, S subunit
MGYQSSGGEMVWCEELGKEIPKGWEVKQLVNICEKIGSGSTPTGGKDSYFKSGISLIRSTNVFDFKFSFDDLAFINEQQANKLGNVEVLEGDVLFNITGVSVAGCCIVPKNVLPARVNQYVMIIKPRKELNFSYYLRCTLCDTEIKNKLLGISQSGSTREAITKSEIEQFEVVKPNAQLLEKFHNCMNNVFFVKDTKSKENQRLQELKDLLLSKLTTVED